MRKQKMLINGEWVDSSSSECLEVRNPATEEVFAEVSRASSQDVGKAAQAAQTAFSLWAKLSPAERANYLYKVSEVILKKSGQIARTLTTEQGKPLKEAEDEVKGSAGVIRYFAEEIQRIYGDVIPAKEAYIKSLVIRQPIGVVAAITPWNYPVQLLAWKVGAALAAGCTVLAKPSSETPLSPLEFLGCFGDAKVPAGVVNGVVGPAVGVMPFKNLSEAIRLANDTRYGLAGYLYTNNVHIIRRVCEELDCGSIGVNNVNVATTNVPYGGWKESGLGRELGREGLEEYMQIKHIKLEFFET